MAPVGAMQNIAVQSVVRRDGQFFHGTEDCRDKFGANLALLLGLFRREAEGFNGVLA
jgi:hypothetical protein